MYPSMLECQLLLSLCKPCLCSHLVEISWVQPPCHIKKTQSPTELPSPLLFLSPLLLCSLNFCAGVVLEMDQLALEPYGQLFPEF